MKRNILEPVKLLLVLGIFRGLSCITPDVRFSEATFKDCIPLLIAGMFIAFWIIEELGGK